MVFNIKKKLRKHFEEISETKTSAHSIGLGFAIGTFIAITPTLGLDLLVGLLIVLIFKNINKLSLFAAMVIWNPLTLIPMHLLSYKIGDFLFSSIPSVKYEVVLLNEIYNFSRRYLIGNLILAITVSFLSYFAAIALTRWYRRKKKRIILEPAQPV